MNIIPFKNRKISKEKKKVRVYRNLNAKTPEQKYSILQGGYVVGHTDRMGLKDVEFIVRSAGKQSAVDTGVRNVHAMILGYPCKISEVPVNMRQSEVKYNPFENEGFTCEGKEIRSAAYVMIAPWGVFAYDKFK